MRRRTRSLFQIVPWILGVLWVWGMTSHCYRPLIPAVGKPCRDDLDCNPGTLCIDKSCQLSSKIKDGSPSPWPDTPGDTNVPREVPPDATPDTASDRCTDGQERECYPPVAGCQKVGDSYRCDGLCRAGKQTCQNAQWGPCEGFLIPQVESCDGQDNDCDGQIDEDFECIQREIRTCGLALGTCKTGTQSCSEQCTWGTCDGEVAPVKEICDDGVDNDCDGVVDNGCIPNSKIVFAAIVPDLATRGSNYTGTITGAGYLPLSTVEISPTPPAPAAFADVATLGGTVAFVSDGELTLSFTPFPTSLPAGNYMLRVLNPGNQFSSSMKFVVQDPINGPPKITKLAPSAAKAGSAYKGTLTGTNFHPSSTIEIRIPIINSFSAITSIGSSVTITHISHQEIVVTITSVPGSYAGLPITGSHDIRVVNPNGQNSNTVKFTIQ